MRTDSVMKPIDLHVHSTRSDGTCSPSELVDYAIQKGLAAFALTDHDTTDGLDEAILYADRLRRAASHVPAASPAPGSFSADSPAPGNLPAEASAQGVSPDAVPEVIPGIEFSTEYQECPYDRGQDIHIVGLYIDYHSPAFAARLQEFVDSRTERNHKMCRLLREAGIDITYEALSAEFPDAVITRAHYAKYMLQHGYVGSIREAFDRYVGDRCSCFVPREKVTPAQAVRLILEAGGIPILAHPILYHMSSGRLERLTASLKKEGLVGIEAIYSTYKPYEEREIRALAAKYDLRLSGGSDFHGSNKPGLDLGTGYGKLFVPYDILPALKGDRN